MEEKKEINVNESIIKSEDKKKLNRQLFIACDRGKLGDVKTLIASGAQVDHIWPRGLNEPFNGCSTCLMYAARSGHLDVVKYLATAEETKKRVQVNALDCENWNALHYSCFNGHADVTEFLLQQNVDTNVISTYEKSTPLGFAQYRRFNDIIVVFQKHFKDEKLKKVEPLSDKEKKEVAERALVKMLQMKTQSLKKQSDTKLNSDDSTFDLKPYLNRYAISKEVFAHICQWLKSVDTATDLMFRADDVMIQPYDTDSKAESVLCLRLCSDRQRAQEIVQSLQKKNVHVLRLSSITSFHFLIVVLATPQHEEVLANSVSKALIISSSS
ncbi:hypothetical protein RFI_22059 [Reticulomyxa filosa]|uniref:Uncharacterized protein n=1 Tax=Reticulomyxa filosa TaxID=46433 RepID=X6MN67_RETFI|nr:hypothetical protein RFI_22059 [Reticulomyxa filosa]|eukprot:ETO15304.1 hypothetical protein RFI_22059 [Reticulomyxa filosa]